MKGLLMSREAVTKVQVAIVVVIIAVAAIAGGVYYYWRVAPPEERGTFMMTVCAHDDWGWGSSSLHALQYVAEKHGLSPESFRDVVSFGDLETVFVEAAAAPEFDVVFWSGIEGAEIVCRHAHKFPDKALISTCLPSADLPYTPPNWATLFFPTAEIGYLLGYLAALMSETKIVAALIPTELMCGNMYANGLRQGVYAADPEVQVIYAESGVWGDPAKDKMTTLALADMGVDVVFGIWTTVGVAEACRERGIYAMGTFNLQEYAPDVVIADGIEDHTTGFDMVVRDYLEGKPIGKAYRIPTHIELNEALVPEHIRNAVMEERNKIETGETVVQYVINRLPDTWPSEPLPVEELVFMDFKGAAYLSEELREFLIEKYG